MKCFVLAIVIFLISANAVRAEDQESRKQCMELLMIAIVAQPINIPKDIKAKNILIPAHTKRPDGQQCFFVYSKEEEGTTYFHLLLSNRGLMVTRLNPVGFNMMSFDELIKAAKRTYNR